MPEGGGEVRDSVVQHEARAAAAARHAVGLEVGVGGRHKLRRVRVGVLAEHGGRPAR